MKATSEVLKKIGDYSGSTSHATALKLTAEDKNRTLLTTPLHYSMVQDILLKADSHSACQTIACFLYGTRIFITVLTKSRHVNLS
jgi:hypothetical protein